MKVDYLAKQKYKPRKPWWEPTLSKSERSSYYQAILQNPSVLGGLELNEKDLFKHTLLEPLSFAAEHYLISDEVVHEPTLLFVYFDQTHDKPILISIKQSAVQLPNYIE